MRALTDGADAVGQVLAVELLVHARDLATATDREVVASETVAEFALVLSGEIITSQARRVAGVDKPVDTAADAEAIVSS